MTELRDLYDKMTSAFISSLGALLRAYPALCDWSRETRGRGERAAAGARASSIIRYLGMGESKRPHITHNSTHFVKVNMCTLPRELREFYRVTDGMFIRWTIKTPGSTDATPLGRIRISPIASLKRVVSEKDAADWAWAQTSGDDASFNVLKWPAFELDSSSSDIRVALVYFSQCAPMMMMMMMMMMCQPI